MSLRFIAAVNRLIQANEQLTNGQLSAAQHAAMREAALIKALNELARICGIELNMPMLIAGNGEISIVAKSETGKGAGCYGLAFVDHLNGFSPQTNKRAGTLLLPENGRCHMHHLNVERMIMAHYNARALVGR